MKDRTLVFHPEHHGHAEPCGMYLYGRTIRQMAKESGRSVEHDDNGKEILDGEMYEVSAEGTFRVQ